ncbi:aminotransferase class III-fold pyridoxal phosphate-dependent enzyme, partial [Klebsiella pneumoniae]|nr:aminotransferase class III-fold pyridoxal phosphate-dependent enzyme [Klebsiella pneumoniae]
MSESVHTNPSLYSKGMLAVICAQFLSAFGDNALLFATLALMKQLYYPEWSQPVLQMLFVGAYILFAPFVGQFADSFAKGRVMMVANGLKLLGAGCICFGVNPFIGYTLVGIGAAAYSPAKYGILGELTTGDKLVKANGLMESSTIAAILLESIPGTAGILVPPAGYMQGVRALADEFGIVLILDEVMAGFGRTGSWFAFEQDGVVPDLVTFAKG